MNTNNYLGKFSSDENMAEYTKILKQYIAKQDSIVLQKIIDLIGNAPDSLNTIFELAESLQAVQRKSMELKSEINGKVDCAEGKELSTNDFTDDIKRVYDEAYTHATSAHSPINAEKNLIVGVQQNGADVIIDSDRKVNLSIPIYGLADASSSGLLSSDDFIKLSNLHTEKLITEENISSYIPQSTTFIKTFHKQFDSDGSCVVPFAEVFDTTKNILECALISGIVDSSGIGADAIYSLEINASAFTVYSRYVNSPSMPINVYGRFSISCQLKSK